MKLVCEVSREVAEQLSLFRNNSLSNLRHQLEQFISYEQNYIILPKDFGDVKLYDLENPEKEVEIRVKEDS
ncbi:hypothetical protein [Pseudoalteromonas phage PH357]|nr:hypothetical protein [Pseudoalteromonas phage PH357]